jgi:hypothetical protein
LGNDYQLYCKDYSSICAKTLTATVTEWVSDPHTPRRELGWVTASDTALRYFHISAFPQRRRKTIGLMAFLICSIIYCRTDH